MDDDPEENEIDRIAAPTLSRDIDETLHPGEEAFETNGRDIADSRFGTFLNAVNEARGKGAGSGQGQGACCFHVWVLLHAPHGARPGEALRALTTINFKAHGLFMP
jgi:hypothetical protein